MPQAGSATAHLTSTWRGQALSAPLIQARTQCVPAWMLKSSWGCSSAVHGKQDAKHDFLTLKSLIGLDAGGRWNRQPLSHMCSQPQARLQGFMRVYASLTNIPVQEEM